jgi:hypothetical protein
MAASYPAAAKYFTNKVDNTDTVIASDVNLAYDEITAIETTLGTTPAVSSTWSGTFDSTSAANWTTVSGRLENIEYGLKVAFDQRVRTTGGSTIASTSTTVGLTISTSGTGNLFAAGNTVINSSGNIVTIDGGTA